MADLYKIVTSSYAETFKSIENSGKGKSKNNTILMGSYVKILDEELSNWQKIEAFGIQGWIKKDNLGDSPDFKCFYVDVGQGDGALIEVGNNENGMKILIDGGPSDNLSRYLSKWQYKFYFDKNIKVHIDYIFISHFDADHYQGLIDIINDSHYTFGTIFHSGIAKFDKDKNSYPGEYNTELGKKITEHGVKYLTTYFDSITDLMDLELKGGLSTLMEKFLTAVRNAFTQNRLTSFKRIDYESDIPSKTINNKQFEIQILGPVTSKITSGLAFTYFDDESHTINGHSLVLKLKYGGKSFLFGGDLNTQSENLLLSHYPDHNVFEVDVAKSCHHGASEFTTDFMACINPLATVISSGDNESYSHPRADAIGCAGKYTRSDRPLVFSTELARSTEVTTNKTKYGMINLRCDGDKIIMAQMKEVSKNGDVWDLYELP
jgi:beta-lactamase superfamily II metal-dependent hydrolase